ncbi:MAG: hypothetical protein K0Q90_3094 [Paenibacillaceae bacterium]|jgi:beta-galactosidase|nr:hypothetical protein [Paenibacillaceae bacterium]
MLYDMTVPRLYAGTNYHPHDWPRERWKKDIALMKAASFSVVRLGHLCWDSFEPAEGGYDFAWLDQVMELFAEAQIGVYLDISTRPAPVWLHRKYPEIDLVDANGQRLQALTRYMEDIGSPVFQDYALRHVEKLVLRYRDHRALLAFGICNEFGDKSVSYSEQARLRFAAWLKERYDSVEALNQAWSARRWSRKLGSWSDVEFPVSGGYTGAPERMLDMWRFFSEETLGFIGRFRDTILWHAPGAAISSNWYPEHPRGGFDYLRGGDQGGDIPNTGFYPGINPENRQALISSCLVMRHRAAESDRPVWLSEFQTGTFGGYGSPAQAMRMYAWLSLLYGSQMVCAWTWRSMLGGEEQYLPGLVDHDGEPGRKYDEFKTIAEEFKRLEAWGFPLRPRPLIALAYSYECLKVSDLGHNYYKTGYTRHVAETFKLLFDANVDCNVVSLRSLKQSYRLLLVPGHCLMDPEAAAALEAYVAGGGTVVMTAYSAKVDEHNRAFDCPLPGRLSHVFGIRTAEYERAYTHVADVNEGGFEKSDPRVARGMPGVHFQGKRWSADIPYFEHVQLRGAAAAAVFDGRAEGLPAITAHAYGRGMAYYTAFPAEGTVLDQLLRQLCKELEIPAGPVTPEGVAARRLDEGRAVYVNLTEETVELELEGPAISLLSGCAYPCRLPLGPYGAELVEYNPKG